LLSTTSLYHSPNAIPRHPTHLKASCQRTGFQARSREYKTRRNNAARFCHRLDFVATSLAASSIAISAIIPYEVLFFHPHLASMPMPEKQAYRQLGIWVSHMTRRRLIETWQHTIRRGAVVNVSGPGLIPYWPHAFSCKKLARVLFPELRICAPDVAGPSASAAAPAPFKKFRRSSVSSDTRKPGNNADSDQSS